MTKEKQSILRTKKKASYAPCVYKYYYLLMSPLPFVEIVLWIANLIRELCPVLFLPLIQLISFVNAISVIVLDSSNFVTLKQVAYFSVFIVPLQFIIC